MSGYTMYSMITQFNNPDGFISYCEDHNCVFDFDKVKDFFRSRIRNLDLLLKVDGMQYPTNIEELMELLFHIHYTFVNITSYHGYEYKSEEHPELVEYMMNRLNNHDYKLEPNQEKTVVPALSGDIKFQYVKESPEDYAYHWLIDEIESQLIWIDYKEFISECLVSSK